MYIFLKNKKEKKVGLWFWFRSLLRINLDITKNTDPHDFPRLIYSALIITNTHVSLRKLNHSSLKRISCWTFAFIVFDKFLNVCYIFTKTTNGTNLTKAKDPTHADHPPVIKHIFLCMFIYCRYDMIMAPVGKKIRWISRKFKR